MTDKQTLLDLAERVEAGDINHAAYFELEQALENSTDVVNAVDGSLDAAKALHDAVLPGWRWRLIGCEATVVMPNHGFPLGTICEAPTAAAAWVAAILRAKAEGES